MAVDENGNWIPFTKKDNKSPKKEEKDVSHRRFNVTLQPVQLYEAFKKSVHNGEIDGERLMTLFRVMADAMNRENPEYNVHMWTHIKSRTEKWFVEQRKRVK
jgi:hypothetical protein